MIVEAIRYCETMVLAAHQTLPFVLGMPRQCPCGDAWLISLDEPLVLEVELGCVGQEHLAMLQYTMQSRCFHHEKTDQLRTDGTSIWYRVWQQPF